MIKKAVATILCMMCLVSLAAPALADDRPIHVTVDGVEMAFTQEYGFPTEVNDRVLLPVRQMFEHFGWLMTYEETEQFVIAARGENEFMMLQIDNPRYYFNNTPIEFDVAPMLIGDRTMVPVRVIAEAMGYDVGYDDATRTVIITTTEADAQ